MLSKRLDSLVKYVESTDQLIDIGCDHALLDIYLVKNKIVQSMIISDIHENALNAGIANIEKNNLTERIDARLGNGLEVLTDKDNIDAILISGMGTSNIINILKNKYLKKVNKLIIQSNNNHEELRREVTKMGFYIEDEEYFPDNKKNYINIVFLRGKRNYSKDELRYGPLLIKNKDYLTFELNNCLKLKELMIKSKLKYKISLHFEIKKIEKYLKRGK